MARTPKSIKQQDVAVLGSTLITVPASTTLQILQITFANTTNTSIKVSLQTGGVYLIKDAPVNVGSSLSIVDRGVIVETTETVVATCDTASACDCHMSYWEIT